MPAFDMRMSSGPSRLERKAAVGAVELHRRHADVERDAVDRADPARGEHAVHLAEIFVDQSQPGVRDE